MKPVLCLLQAYYRASRLPELLAPAFDLGLRIYLASVFFKSGLVKVADWEATRYLFNEVYHVPFLPPDLAAVLAASAELGLSSLLVLGLLGRFAAAGLFILNGVAVISFPDLSEAGLNQHLSWGILLGVLLVLSRGRWSADQWISRKASGSCQAGNS
jgi:putative oxidoreductase